jgi:hypothetical protein
MALNMGLDALYDNIQGRKVILDEGGEVNGAKLYGVNGDFQQALLESYT